MRKSIEIIQERNQKIQAQKALVDAAKNEDGTSRDLNADEQKQFRVLQGEIDDLKNRITDAKAYEENQRAAAAASAPVDTKSKSEDREMDKVTERASIVKMLRAANPLLEERLEGAEKELHEIGIQEERNAEIKNIKKEQNRVYIPIRALTYNRATQQTVTQDSGEYGGALVQNQAPRMIDPLRPKLALEDAGATFLTGLSGGDIPLIVDNDFAMAFVAEGATLTPQKKKYEGPTLSPKRAGGAVDMSNQLLLQSSVDVENRVGNGLRNGFSQLLHAACINGAGGVAPTGVISYTGVNQSSVVAAAAATWAMIVELQELIESNDSTENSLHYLLNPKLKGHLKQIKKDAGSGRFLMEGTEIDGYNAIVTSQVPALDDGGTPVQPLIFGDWSQMAIGQWGAISVLVDPYSASLADSVRLVLNTHADMQIANPKAFAVNGFINAG